jgi:hypothetical protein
MAYACHENGLPYVLTWGLADGVMSATIFVTGENIPLPKRLPKPLKVENRSRLEAIYLDAAHRLDAYHGANLKQQMSWIRDRAFVRLVACASIR